MLTDAGLAHLRRSNPAAGMVLQRYAARGIVLQVVLRILLVVFCVATLVMLPPAVDAPWSFTLAGLYAVLTAVSSVWLLRGRVSALRRGWLVLYLDLVALTAITLSTVPSAVDTWTSDVLVRGLFVLPVLAATQLRPGLCAGVGVPTVLVHLGITLAIRPIDDEPWQSIALRTVAVSAVVVAAVGLSRIQRFRFQGLAALVAERVALLTEITTLEQRERRLLAENLHDGALQYILAARGDLEDLVDGDASAATRVDEALRTSATLLRDTVSGLHPAVLEQAGLAAALPALVDAAGARGDLDARLDTTGWPTHERTDLDGLLYGCARELITNVVKHSGAHHLTVTLARVGNLARLTVTDDGTGLDPAVAERRVAQGHIGLASRRAHLEAAGGSLTIRPAVPTGTVVDVTAPFAA
ncbi:hypothetical protein JL107_16305 [Nakamurella flavida]|uniref:Histidine kinase/HSP90-like ATPase domain-containing protein n=1 Tax=Nakamurella flavida TaxID=363630 RepID=A0A938YL53_9ACTN|nr:ATP-binding protein [Nakamurella flavida]MBM9478012.1 hypothetical protein [Nakamurella flavida]MDP9778271.1 two-component system NarL family sensor kinase [Nakamurella flavida]